jgi:hypothetical protein
VTGQIIGDAANLLVGVTGYFHVDNAQQCRQLWLFIHRCCPQLWQVLLTFVTWKAGALSLPKPKNESKTLLFRLDLDFLMYFHKFSKVYQIF